MHIFMNRKYHILILLLTVAVAACALAPSDGEASAKDKTIVMFVPDTDWPPYFINDPKSPCCGVLVEVLKAAAEPMGYTVKARKYPNKRGWALLEDGDVDVHVKAKEWVKNPDRFLWTAPFMESEDILLYSANSTLEYTSPKALYGKTVAAMEGFVYPVLEAHFGPGKIIRVDATSPYTMLDLLDHGRVDAALVNKSETQWLFRNRPNLKPERFRMDKTSCDKAWYRYVFTKESNWQPFIKEFNKTLKAMKKDGRLKAIMDQYR